MKKRLLVFVLCVSMVIGNLSLVSADEIAENVNVQETVSGNENAEIPDGFQRGTETAEKPEELVITGMLPEESASVSDAEDNDELFEGYVEKLFLDSQEKKRGGSYTNDRLSGIDAAVYGALRGYISLAASGERSSTVFPVAISELGLDKTSWTAADLGVDAIVVDGAFSEEAVNAAYNLLKCDLHLVLTALLADCPYELYWYDKTEGTEVSYPQITAQRNGTEWFVSFSGDMTFSFAVAQGYSAGVYTVDTGAALTARTAASNARAIVDLYSSYSDYDKLLAYKNEICTLVSYNDEAAAGGISFGNPWQLIWVFDGDAGTNVVCEGYSKAFKYLCDMSAFNSDQISCITVTGTMTGGTGAGPHMWNIVRMDDGKNYLVDVTNCDEGTIGAPDRLFLTGTENGDIVNGYLFHGFLSADMLYTYDQDTLNLYNKELYLASNAYEAGIVITEPVYTWTETDDGYTVSALKECKEDPSQNITEEVSASYQVVVSATCTDEGKGLYTAEFTNSVFETQTKEVKIPAAGHTPEVLAAVAPTCTETGLTEGSQCSVCGAILKEQEIVPALGHDWGEPAWSWKTTAEDVYISAAAAFTCGHDGTHKEELEDTELDVVTVDPTPAEAGSITYTASVTGPDGKTYTDSKEVPIPAAGYTYKDPAYTWVKTEEGYLVKALKECCEDAGQNITEEAEAAYTEKTAAACTSEGMGLYTAVFTNSAFETQTKEVVIPATGHSWDEGKVTRPPTYTETGIMTYTCTVCGETKTEEIDKLEPEEPEIEVKHSLNLQDEILVNFYYIGVDADQAADSSVKFTFEGKETVVTGGKATKVGGKPTVVYTFATAAKKMTEPIKAELTIAGEVVDTHEYTVKQYCDDQLAKADIDAGLKKLLEATLNYGGYSQVNFNYNTDKMANAGIDSTLAPLSPSAIEAPAFDKAAVNTGVKAAGLTYEGASLALEASTNLKFYFKPSGITQDAALKVPVKVNGKEAQLEKNGKYVCLTITGIKAKYLGQAYDITVGSYTFRYSPLNYIRTQLDGTNTNLKNVLTAMYYYYQAAKEYFNA